MKLIKADGRLRHCFFGTYYATIALRFSSHEDALKGFEVLGTNWKISDTTKSALVFHGKNPELEDVLSTLEKFGADRKKVTSLAKSVDFGDPFQITIEV